MKIADLPIVFMSYDEPWADRFWDDLRAKAPWARRVHGVAGLDACHKAALEKGGGDWVITVDADTLVRPSFFDAQVPEAFLRPNCRTDWPSRNSVNGLSYGNGSLKLWPARLVRAMRTHEAAPRGKVSVDHDIGLDQSGPEADFRGYVPEIHADVEPAMTPYHGFRCGFREGVRLALAARDGRMSGAGLRTLPERQLYRLQVWCSVGGDQPNGDWLIHGARLGLWMAHSSDWNPARINSYAWFDRFWSDLIAPRFGPGPVLCPLTGYRWDAARLQDETAALGQRLQGSLGLEVLDLTPGESRLFRDSTPETLDWRLSDHYGYLCMKGRGVPADPLRARTMFEVGALNEVAASVNNLARLRHLGLDPDNALETAEALYGRATELGDRFAPYHLATLLEETAPDAPGQDLRIAALKALAAQRGFDPDGLSAAGAEGVAGAATGQVT